MAIAGHLFGPDWMAGVGFSGGVEGEKQAMRTWIGRGLSLAAAISMACTATIAQTAITDGPSLTLDDNKTIRLAQAKTTRAPTAVASGEGNEVSKVNNWTVGLASLTHAVNLFVVARGFGLGIAQEAALKLKETCGLHAEAFSSAEVKHGPMALVRAGFPVLMFSQDDETRAGIEQLATEFGARKAKVLLAGAKARDATVLPTIVAHPVIEPILQIQSFYRLANNLSLARGLDPDRPPHLNKVTETV